MLTLENIASNYFETTSELEMPPEEGVASQESFQQSKVCWLCEQALRENPGNFQLGDTEGASHDKVRDHDRLRGKYRGAAHNRCNLNCKKSQVRLFPYFSIISVGMIVILSLKNS